MTPRPRTLGRIALTAWLLLSGNTGAQEAQDHVQITEFLASNETQLPDANGDQSDWLELWNPTEETVNLEGWHLTDQEGEARWTFPSTFNLAPGEHRVVRASGGDEVVGDEWHTNFRIARGGGYLALVAPDGTTVIDAWEDYPSQRTDISYGRDSRGGIGFFKRPTPGTENGSSIQGFVEDTKFSVKRGFYDEPFDLAITTATPDAKILYTLDGSAPKEGTLFTPDHGETYTGPISISSTTTLRAIALKSGYETTNIDTQTYIFTDDVAQQPEQPEEWPQDWGTNGEVPGRVVADYAMDPRVVENTLPNYSLREALLDIPTLSIVMNRDDFIGDDGIYTNPQSRTEANPLLWEKPCSLELIYPDEREGFQIDCGVEVHGNSSRRPWRMQKHSLRVSFKTIYGASRLRFPFFENNPIEEFNKLVLRACFTDSWGLVSWGPGRYRPNDSQYIRDMWMKRSFGDMGHDTLDGNFMHLYVNGLYWGLFNPAEKMEAETMVQHLGGSEEDYDIIDDFERSDPIAGTAASWDEMHRLARADLDKEENYRALEELCDLENFADYMLLHFFGDAEDWPHHNGHAMRNRGAGEPFRFYVWDQEIVLDNLRMRRYDANDNGRPGGLFQLLRRSDEFRLLFADRVQKHLFNGGALSVEAAQDRYLALANEIDKAIVAESARWGDTQMSTPYGNTIDQPRDPNNVDDLAYPPAPNGPDYFFTREDSWVVERDNVINHYLPAIHDLTNGNALLNELEDEDLWPKTNAPAFNQHGGHVTPGFQLKILPTGGFRGSDTLYYTTDGSDPRAFGGQPSANAQSFDVEGEGIELTQSVWVKARLQSRSNPFLIGGEWSPTIEALFRVGDFASPEVLRISELMYNPAAPTEDEVAAGFDRRRHFEYIEIFNPSSQPVILEGLQFSRGVQVGSLGTGPTAELAPGARALLVNHPEAMALRYGANLPIVGTFAGGTQLANNGERLTLSDAIGTPLIDFAYDDRDGWPQEADGDGYALDLTEAGLTGDPSLPSAWQASASVGGSPGTADTVSPSSNYATWRQHRFSEDAQSEEAISGPLADPDKDGWKNLFEYAFDTDPNVASGPQIELERTEQDGQTLLELRHPLTTHAADVILSTEFASDLTTWTTEGITLHTTASHAVARLPLAPGEGGYLRLRVGLNSLQNGE